MFHFQHFRMLVLKMIQFCADLTVVPCWHLSNSFDRFSFHQLKIEIAHNLDEQLICMGYLLFCKISWIQNCMKTQCILMFIAFWILSSLIFIAFSISLHFHLVLLHVKLKHLCPPQASTFPWSCRKLIYLCTECFNV